MARQLFVALLLRHLAGVAALRDVIFSAEGRHIRAGGLCRCDGGVDVRDEVAKPEALARLGG